MTTPDRVLSTVRYGAMATLSAAMLGAPCVQAQALEPVESRIAQVTLYPGSATVERVVKVAAGSQKITFACLPAALDPQSLAVSADASVRVGELSLLTQEREASPACGSTPLDARIQALEDKKALLGAENDALAMVTGYLRGLTPAQSGNGVHLPPDPKNLAAVADALRRSGQDTLARQHQITRLQEELDRTLKPLQAERTRVLAGRARVASVSVTLDAAQAAEVRLRYQISGPGWAPSYRALLDTRSASLRLERQAQVAQNTGEDWLGVPLRLSTGQPRRGTTGPTPHPWRIGIAEPQPQARSIDAGFAMAAAPAPAPPRAKAVAAQEQAAPTFDVSVFNNSYATEFVVPQRIDVPSSGQRVTLALGAQDASATLLTRTTPQLDASAWLVAELPQPEGVWPSGALQLYRDGAYVGTDTLRTGTSGPLALSFGRDELVVVRVEPQKDLRASTGFVGSRAERSVQRAYTVENRHRTPIKLQVLEAAPVAVDERVAVDTEFDPKPDAIAWNEQPGVALWSMPVDVGKTVRLHASYAIRYPKDARLQETR